MAYADPQSTHNPTAGQAIPAAWGDIVRDDLQYLSTNKPHCEGYNTSPQSIAHNTLTALLFPSETFDVGGMHSTSSNTDRFTVPSGEAGKYDIRAGGVFAANATGQRQIVIYKNGANLTPARVGYQPGNGTYGAYLQVTANAVPLVAGDYITITVYQDSSVSLNFDDYWATVMWVAI